MNHEKRSRLALMDFYELSLANAFFSEEIDDTAAWFDIFFRPSADVTGFCIMAGLEQAVDYIESLRFSQEDIAFLRGQGMAEPFLAYLKDFHFACDIWAVPEGTPVFPGEPIVKVHGPMIQAQLIEAILLLSVNHQTQIATKANRIVRAAQGRGVVEFGARKAQGVDSAVFGARAAYIGGCIATTCAAAAKDYAIEPFSAMSHSWILSFDSEEQAFRAYARQYPDNCILLIDTYDTMHSGLPAAIKAFREEILPRGFRPRGVRIDSGDLAYLSKRIRRVLNEEGFPDCDIIASNQLDEFIIKEMISNGARIDTFLVGEKLI
ncbi:MAG: nicotinate phosphoribosyltransferase, partial [Oscillospiraceae bacterium]|nr:nicotinate phosphoribosyltransferase [Oscillospiraceae bacterium]